MVDICALYSWHGPSLSSWYAVSDTTHTYTHIIPFRVVFLKLSSPFSLPVSAPYVLPPVPFVSASAVVATSAVSLPETVTHPRMH